MSMSGGLFRRCLTVAPVLRRAARCGLFKPVSAMKQSVIPRVLCATIHTSTPRFGESSNVIHIQSSDDFKERVLQNELPVVLDFHASWCGPCKMLGPRLETLVGQKKDKVILAKVDIDQLSDIAIDHGVEAVPTVLAMKGGKVVDKFVGLKEDDILETFIEKLTG